MKIKLVVLAGLGALALSGCAQWNQEWAAQNCNPTAAYADGMNDGMQPNGYMQTNFASLCPQAQQSSLNATYQKGFNDGLKGRQANAIEDQSPNSNNSLNNLF